MPAKHDEVITHLRALRADCARGKAWSSALIWAEKAVLLSNNIDDLLWLVDALVTNGQYRQAEEWLAKPTYASKWKTTFTGRYLASVIAMRLGRAEDALGFLSMDDDEEDDDDLFHYVSNSNNASMATRSRRGKRHGLGSTRGRHDPLQTPTRLAGKAGGARGNVATPLPLTASFANFRGDDSSFEDSAGSEGKTTFSHQQSSSTTVSANGVPSFNTRAWSLYMQGAAVLQLSNIGGNETTPSIKGLHLRYGDRKTNAAHTTPLGSMGTLIASIWTDALHNDPQCWEAWTGLREQGLLTCEEELDLVNELNWAACCGGSERVGMFFKNYCLATQLPFSLSNATMVATCELLTTYPHLVHDPALQVVQATRLMSQSRVRESLSYTVRVLEYRRVPDPNATAVHITALTVLYAKDALFRISHELAEEFGISSIRRIDIEPRDTNTGLGTSMTDLSLIDGFGAGSSQGGLPSTPRGVAMGSSVAGGSLLRAGARGLLLPDTPFRISATGAMQRQVSGAQSARSAFHSSSTAATAAWRGLWGLPTWTQPGPPVLATYPSALGPAQGSAVNAEASVSTLGTFTTTNAQSMGIPTQYEFVGASVAWYAIGCYYLVSAALLASPNLSKREWVLGSFVYDNGLSAATIGLQPNVANGHRGVGNMAARNSQPLSPEAEHALAESRRWLAKTTLASPRSIVAWVAFAHTFIVSGEWESATRALHTAVGLCGCEGIVHGGGRDTDLSNESELAQEAAATTTYQTPLKKKQKQATATTSKKKKAVSGASEKNKTEQLPDYKMERGSQLAHAPLASLGSVYLQMGDIGMAESCFDASVRCLSGYRISEWLSIWDPIVGAIENKDILEWCSAKQQGTVGLAKAHMASVEDPQLLNDIGVLYYDRGEMESARIFSMTALATLNTIADLQNSLNAAFNPIGSKRNGKYGHSKRSVCSPENQSLGALLMANLGNTLRKLGDYEIALECLESASAQLSDNMDILLSVAFTYHSRAITNTSYVDTPTTTSVSVDIDQAIDIYHQILSVRPGDPVTTDLLTLALELASNAQDIPYVGDEFDDRRKLGDDDLESFEIRDPDDILGVQQSQDANDSTSVQPDSSDQEDSDQAMEMVEDSGSESDMAID